MILPAPGLDETALPAGGAAARYGYYAFGMSIHADLALPELQPHDSEAADLVIRREDLRRQMPDLGQAVFEFDRADAYLGFGGVGQFSLLAPGLVTYEPWPGVDPSLVNLVLLGAVMATVLHRRGKLAMHASGIDIGGRGAVFMGNKGAGKSTTAAAFIRAGHRLLTDDVLPIETTDDGRFRILPGFPQLKLSEMAAGSIALADATTTPISDIGFYKSRLRLAGSFSGETVAPAVFYVLARGEAFAAMPLAGPQAMAALMANSYHARFGTQVFHGAAAAAHMQQCAALARAVPVRRLVVPRDLDQLAELVRFVERDIA